MWSAVRLPSFLKDFGVRGITTRDATACALTEQHWRINLGRVRRERKGNVGDWCLQVNAYAAVWASGNEVAAQEQPVKVLRFLEQREMLFPCDAYSGIHIGTQRQARTALGAAQLKHAVCKCAIGVICNVKTLPQRP